MNLKEIIFSLIYRLFFIFPIGKKKIVFSNFYGMGYGDSPRFIADELRKIDKIKIYWIVDTKFHDSFPDNIILLKKNTIKCAFVLATAKVWVDNCRKQIWVKKRKKQYYVQTWHGGTWFKKAEKDAEYLLKPKYVKIAIHDSMMTDVVLSSSKWNSQIIKSSFWYGGTILETGLPRSDTFFRNTSISKNQVKKCYGINDESKLVLYAPTFRDNGDIDCYDLRFEELLDKLNSIWRGNWRILVRLHPNVADKIGKIKFSERILNGNIYPDINELIVAADFVITDYSSCMFDAMLSRKRVVIYASDYDNFVYERGGFYFDIDSLPFNRAKDNEQLYEIITNFDDSKYYKEIETFIKKMGYFEDGRASKRVASHILSVMGR